MQFLSPFEPIDPKWYTYTEDGLFVNGIRDDAPDDVKERYEMELKMYAEAWDEVYGEGADK